MQLLINLPKDNNEINSSKVRKIVRAMLKENIAYIFTTNDPELLEDLKNSKIYCLFLNNDYKCRTDGYDVFVECELENVFFVPTISFKQLCSFVDTGYGLTKEINNFIDTYYKKMNLSSFSYKRDKEIDEAVLMLLKQFTSGVISENRTKIITLYLTGSFGRGEGAVEKIKDDIKLLNNVDVLIVSKYTKDFILKNDIIRISKEILDKYGVGVDFSILHPGLLKFKMKSLYLYDVLCSSKHLYGKDILSKYKKNLNFKNIDRIEFLYLITNRLAAFLTAYITKSDVSKKYYYRSTSKLLIALTNTRLWLSGEYASSYSEKNYLMKKMKCEKSYLEVMELAHSFRKGVNLNETEFALLDSYVNKKLFSEVADVLKNLSNAKRDLEINFLTVVESLASSRRLGLVYKIKNFINNVFKNKCKLKEINFCERQVFSLLTLRIFYKLFAESKPAHEINEINEFSKYYQKYAGIDYNVRKEIGSYGNL